VPEITPETELAIQLKQIELEEAKFRLEEYKIRSAERQRKLDDNTRRAKQIATDEQMTRERYESMQRYCKHRKGGKDFQGFLNGSSNEYAVIHHLGSLGEEGVYCQRCPAKWVPGDTAQSHPTGISYEEAVRWPTDNSTSSSVTFTIPKRA
jgi:hypothetical protein